MSININLTNKRITVPAYSPLEVSATGAMLYVKYSTAPIRVSLDGGQEFDLDMGWRVIPPSQFKKIVFHNKTSSDITLEFYTGSAGLVYSSPNVMKDAPTFVLGSDIQTLVATATQQFSGVNNGHVRRQFIVQNLSAASQLYVLDSGGRVATVLFPQTSWTIPTGDALTVKNPQGNPNVNFVVTESFYA